MSNQRHKFTYHSSEGKDTDYDVQEVRHGDRPPMYVVSEAPDNPGPGFEHVGTRDAVAHEAATMARKQYGLQPHQVNLYQQRPDGDFDQVQFRTIGRDQGMAPSQPTQWGEYHRTPQTREAVERSLEAPVAAPRETPQQLQQRQSQEYREMSAPREFNRSEVDRAELQSFEQKVETQHEEQRQQQKPRF